MQPADGRVPAPEGAKDLDQTLQRRVRVCHRHRVRDPGKTALSRDFVEHRLQQGAPRAELIVDGQPRDARRLRDRLQREAREPSVLAQAFGGCPDDAVA